MKTRILICILVFVPLVHVPAQETRMVKQLTFRDALNLSLQNNHMLKQAGLLKLEKHQEVLAARSLYLPRIGLSGAYTAMSDKLHLDLTPVRDAVSPLYSALGNYGQFSGVPNPDPATNQQMPVLPDDVSTQLVRAKMLEGLASVENGDWDILLQKKDFATLNANLIWPLYAGGKIRSANKIAEIREEETNETDRQKRGELISELAERYYGLSLAIQAVKVRQEVYDGMNQHLQDALRMEEQGMVAAADVLHAQVYTAQAERELSKARRNVEVLNQALSNTLALEKHAGIDPLSCLFYLDTIEPLSYFEELAERKNPLLKQIASKQQQAQVGERIERAAFLPAIAIQGTYDLANKDLSPYAPQWVIGVGMQWNLFDGNARLRKIRAAGFRTGQVEEFSEKSVEDVLTMVNKLYQELNMYREQLMQLETARSFTDEYVRVREKAYHEQMAGATELVDARLAQAQVLIERLQAIYGYDVSLVRLLEFSGIPEQYTEYQTRPGVKTETYIH